MKHCTKKKHLEHLNTRKENTALPASWLGQNPDPPEVCHPCNIPYRASSNIYEDATCPTMDNTIPIRTAAGFNDQILPNEAFIICCGK